MLDWFRTVGGGAEIKCFLKSLQQYVYTIVCPASLLCSYQIATEILKTPQRIAWTGRICNAVEIEVACQFLLRMGLRRLATTRHDKQHDEYLDKNAGWYKLQHMMARLISGLLKHVCGRIPLLQMRPEKSNLS